MKKITSFFTAFLLTLTLVSQTLAFNDVPSDSWYAVYVNDLAQKGVVDNAEKYRPEDDVNRAEMAKMVVKAMGETGENPLPGHPTFDDAPLDAWFTPFVERLATLGIASGYQDAEGNLTGIFGVADKVTRAQAVKMLVEAFDLKATDANIAPFSDVQSMDWFYPYVTIASSLGLVNGYEDGSFGPNKPIKRSEMAKIVSLAIKASKPTPPTTEPPVENPPATEPPATEPPANTPEPVMATPNPAILNTGIAIGGETQKLVSRYNFQGTYEGFTISTLTLVNDTTGTTYGDDTKSSLAIKDVTLKYPDKNGYLKTATAPLKANGTVRFGNLDFFVKRDVDCFLEVYVNLNQFSDLPEGVSGETFRLAIQNTNNTLDTFKAVGEFSSDSLTLGQEGLAMTYSSQEQFTFRKSQPTLKLGAHSSTLLAGTNTLITLEITANQAASLALGRLTFDLNVNDADNANLNFNNFKLFDGSDAMDNLTIYDATGGQDVSPSGGGSLTDGNYKIIVSFDDEETISAGQTKIYKLKADVTGSANNDSVNTALAAGDESQPLSGLTAAGQENTGKLFVNGDVTAGIFTAADTDFSQLATSNTNFLWSDFSAKPHQIAQITNGTITSDSGSADWTNGFLLGITNLESSILTK